MDALINKYQLAPHPEGGFYKEIFRSDFRVHSDQVAEERNAVTQIYFLLPKGQVSRFHKVCHDEIWHFYEGAPLTLIQYDGKKFKEIQLGPGMKEYTAIVPADTWQAAQSTGEYSFMGCTVAPGFDFKDFSFLADNGPARAAFEKAHPAYTRFL